MSFGDSRKCYFDVTKNINTFSGRRIIDLAILLGSGRLIKTIKSIQHLTQFFTIK